MFACDFFIRGSSLVLIASSDNLYPLNYIIIPAVYLLELILNMIAQFMHPMYVGETFYSKYIVFYLIVPFQFLGSCQPYTNRFWKIKGKYPFILHSIIRHSLSAALLFIFFNYGCCMLLIYISFCFYNLFFLIFFICVCFSANSFQ